MKQFLIGGFILAFVLGSMPVMAESDQRRSMLSSSSGAERGKAAPEHKKFLTSRYRDDHGHRGGHRGHKDGHRSRGHYRDDHGWRGHPGRHHGWKKGKRHHWKHGYHGHKRHWNKHRGSHHKHRYHGTRYRFHYNGLVGPGPGGGHISIDLSRR